MSAARDLSLGLLAGGEGRRVGGCDKAWLPRGGRPRVDALLEALPLARFGQRLASARADDTRWRERGFDVVRDRRSGFAGPLAGLEALALACTGARLLVLPVDLLDPPADLLERLLGAAGEGSAWVRDADGRQPLVGLWRPEALARAAGAALDGGNAAVHRALATLAPAVADLAPARLGNANTPDDYDPT